MPAGKLLIILGLVIAAIGAAIAWAPWLVSWFGRLPGDVRIEKEGGSFYFPIVSMIVVSIVLTIVMNVLFRR